MAFFDEWGKKISQAGQAAVQKGKELADIAKINSAVSDEERKINDTYREIGKLYFSLHGEDPGVDFAPMVAAIRESESRIVEYKQQIKDIKGVVCCEKCGAEVAVNAAFCSACGAPMPVVKPVETPEQAAEEGAEESEAAGNGQEACGSCQTQETGNDQEASEGCQDQACGEASESDQTQTGI